MSYCDGPNDGTVGRGQVVFENTTNCTRVSTFSRITSQASFAHSKAAEGDLGGKFVLRQLAFVMSLDDRPNQEWDCGEGHVHQDDVREGDCFLYLADRPCCSSGESPFEFLALFLDPAFVTGCVGASLSPDQIELRGQGCLRDPLMNGILHALRQEQKRHGGIDRLYGESLATALAIHSMRNYATRQPVVADLAEGGLGKASLRRALDYIGDNLDRDLGLDGIATSVNLSPYHFSRLFKQTVGETPYQYVIALRVDKAKLLLRQGRMTMSEIAQAVGFCDQSHLIRHFKRKTGVTPSVFRA